MSVRKETAARIRFWAEASKRKFALFMANPTPETRAELDRALDGYQEAASAARAEHAAPDGR